MPCEKYTKTLKKFAKLSEICKTMELFHFWRKLGVIWVLLFSKVNCFTEYGENTSRLFEKFIPGRLGEYNDSRIELSAFFISIRHFNRERALNEIFISVMVIFEISQTNKKQQICLC